MSDIRRSNREQHMRRNPIDEQGKVTGARGDLVGDEDDEVTQWQELVDEDEGRSASNMDEVGSAQDSILGGTGSLDQVQRPLYDHEKNAKERDE